MTTHPDRLTAADDTDFGPPTGLGPLLLRTRRAQARSQQRLAEQLCAVAATFTVSRHEVSRWERGERIPSPYWLAWLGVVLDLPLTDLERAAAVTRDRRVRSAAPATAAAALPASARWPWRLIPAYAVVTPDGGIRLQASPPVDSRRRMASRR